MTTKLPEANRYSNRIRPTPLAPIQLDAEDPVIWCKLEFLNPSGSTKDRLARFIMEKAWRRGDVGPESVVVEATGFRWGRFPD
jgi:cysteine synthase